jgi:hypothetical protein
MEPTAPAPAHDIDAQRQRDLYAEELAMEQLHNWALGQKPFDKR